MGNVRAHLAAFYIMQWLRHHSGDPVELFVCHFIKGRGTTSYLVIEVRAGSPSANNDIYTPPLLVSTLFNFLIALSDLQTFQEVYSAITVLIKCKSFSVCGACAYF